MDLLNEYNDYFSVFMYNSIKISKDNKTYDMIGLHDCTKTSHVTEIFKKDTVRKFGTLYCANNTVGQKKIA